VQKIWKRARSAKFSPIPKDKRSGFVRVIDDSDEDYLYPESYFAPIDLQSEVKQELLA
jgi:hypothetical protein